jgi:hypothetical protein
MQNCVDVVDYYYYYYYYWKTNGRSRGWVEEPRWSYVVGFVQCLRRP